MKPSLYLTGLLSGVLIGLCSVSFGKVFHWPEVCEKGTLVIHNQSSIELRFFLQTFDPRLISEDGLVVSANSTFSIDVAGFSKENFQKRLSLLSLDSSNSKYQVNFKCQGQNFPASHLQSGEWVFETKSSLKTHKLWIKNLTPQASTYELITFNETTAKSRTIDLQPFEQKGVLVKDAEQWPFFKLKSSSKVSVFYLDHTTLIPPIKHRPVAFKNVDSFGVYFEVQNREKTEDSFVVHITDNDMIARARAVLANPESEKIVVGEIKIGPGNHNRNLNSSDHAPWSWHVSRVTNFSDFASTACNGLPQIVEDRFQSWAYDPGRICFWTYRLKRELLPSEL